MDEELMDYDLIVLESDNEGNWDDDEWVNKQAELSAKLN